ncbi:MAG: tRNA pseudouridine(54/55) synthase Pus10 [Promethearchaeota archaeon]
MTLGNMVKKAQKILRYHTIDDWCLGRQFAMHGYGLTNKERGIALKTILLMSATETYQRNPKQGITLLRRLAEQGQFLPAREFLKKEGVTDLHPSQPCDICGGVMKQLPRAAQAIIRALKNWELSSILIGTRVSPSIIETEEQLRSEIEINMGEPIKAELNREIGKLVTTKLKLDVSFDDPDIVALTCIPEFDVELEVHSLFIYGRYQKLVRGIPQTRWPCRECKGKGCPRCNETGKMYAESVEELIAPGVLQFTEGTDVKFHGAGREDIDALMLGTGRPFVIEVLNPRIRSISLKQVGLQINKSVKGKVKVHKLRFANKEVVQRLKSSATSSKKLYKALVHVEASISQDTLKALQELSLPLEVNQRTPQRVSHRRSDKVRKKRVDTIEVIPIDPKTFELTIRCQGGLYVKEFISGDEGRTVPSIAEILGTSAECTQLDVIAVEIEEDKLPW